MIRLGARRGIARPITDRVQRHADQRILQDEENFSRQEAARAWLAVLRHDLGRPGEAEPELRAVVAELTEVLGPDHLYTLRHRAHLALLLRDRGQADEARAVYAATAHAAVRALGEDRPLTRQIRSGWDGEEQA